MAMIVETERLVIRELEEADRASLEPMLNDPTTMRFWPRPYTSDEVREWIQRHRQRYADDGCGYWLVSLRDGTPIGQAGIMRQQFEWPEQQRPSYWGLGYILHHPFWGQGYATEAGRACLDWAFSHLQTDRVVALIRPENEPSRAVAHRLGMREMGSVMYYGFEHGVHVLDQAL